MATWRVISVADTKAVPEARGVDLALPTQEAARAQATIERSKAGITKTSVHLCPHAAGEDPSEWFDCKTDPRAQYEEL